MYRHNYEVIFFSGASGRKYAFNICPIDNQFSPLGAIYYFIKREKIQYKKYSHERIYLDHTDDLSKLLDDHPKSSCIRKRGVNYLYVYIDKNEQSRKEKIKDLLNTHIPPCNTQDLCSI